jgi:GNAT superfamily N-acetyltransferase
MTVRLATKDDAQAIHDLHTASVTQLCTLYDRDTIDGWLHGRTPEGYKGIARQEMYVYEDSGRIIAFSHVVPGEIVALFVSPDSARMGIGTAMMAHAMPVAWRNWQGPLKLESTLNAVVFYEVIGFKKIRDLIVHRNNIEIPVVLMEKDAP